MGQGFNRASCLAGKWYFKCSQDSCYLTIGIVQLTIQTTEHINYFVEQW
jgi:hypothetical protein